MKSVTSNRIAERQSGKREKSPARTSTTLMRILLILSLTVSVAVAKDAAGVRIMTQNMDAGTDLHYALLLGAPLGIDLTLAEIQASQIPERAALLGARIAAELPDLVALEEVTLWRVGPTPETATQILYDQLELLLGALAASGAEYEVVTVNNLTDLALPGSTGALRITDRDALLMRSGLRPPALHLSDVHTHIFQAGLSLEGFRAEQGWISATVHTGNHHFRLAVTHLESAIPFFPAATEVQVAQTGELLRSLRHLPTPVVICGDFNSDADFGSGIDATPSAALIEAAGYADSWKAAHPSDPGFTWPLYSEDGIPPEYFAPSTPYERIDLFFSRGLQVLAVEQVLAPAPAGILPSYGSDHAGVIATFGF
jgi:endonuclease/exonuclease/phosphatase family metal-dependent hydrolase